ncbi:MAG TPA: hypothetical protein VNH11_28005 [Pirellulales bacterium]|nr:hypothetical protein [Pirellulales bacterium]
MDIKRSHTVLYRFFSGLAEYTFEARLGVADPPLVDYIALLLTRFMHCDAIYQVRNPSGRRLEEVAQMLVEADARIGNPRREVHRHIGDFTLFWTGVYPEALRRLKDASRLDYFVDYCEQGKRAYHIAATIETAGNAQENEVLERLSHDFELCAFGLGELRREWERRDPEGGLSGPIIIN